MLSSTETLRGGDQTNCNTYYIAYLFYAILDISNPSSHWKEQRCI